MSDHSEHISILSSLSGTTIGVIGDVMLDKYTHGRIERISPEAPVPVLVSETVRYVPGGAGNAAVAVASLGAVAELVGVVGSDESGGLLDTALTESGVKAILHTDPSRPTTVKHRVTHRGRHLLRIDEEAYHPLSPAVQQAVLNSITERIQTWNAIVIADYAKGCMSAELAQEVMRCARTHQVPVVIDTKPAHFGFYGSAAVFTPNMAEALRMAETEDVFVAGTLLSQRTASPILITRGKDGMTLFIDTETHHLDTYASTVVDVSGAGDTVAATISVLLASGVSLKEAMHVANSAAAIVISKEGTAAVSSSELTTFLKMRES